MEPKIPCLPVDNGYPVMSTNPYCNNGYGWLNEGECGCAPGSAGYIPSKKGCSVKCVAVGPNDCPKCKKPINWALYGGLGLAAIVFFSMGSKK
jgi:hypothetical protein